MMRWLIGLGLSAVMAGAAEADLILYNGKIVTVDAGFSIREAVAVKGGRITAVGTSRQILRSERGPRTRAIDLAGRTVLPGLIDSHVHPLEAGLSEFREPLPPLDSYAAIQEYIRAQARKTAKGEWIVVPRTFPTRLAEMRMPTRELLDVTQDHPVLFDASYVVVVNSLALRLSGITRETPDPPHGEIVKDARGEPNGILRNAQSLLKGLKAGAAFSEQERLAALERMLRMYREAGITMIGEGGATPEEIALYQTLKAEGRLPVRVVVTWWVNIARPAEELIGEIRSRSWRTNEGDDWLKFGAFKVNFDGGMTIGTAYQRQPYGEFGRQLYGKTDPEDRGQLFATPDKFLAVFRAARERGWSLSAHTQGGGAIDLFLDTMEALDRERAIAPTRSHLIHASFQSPEAIARMQRLGVTADVQAAWLHFDAPALEKVFGYEGLRYFFPLRSYLQAGVRVAGGSDHMIGYDKNRAVNPYNPFHGMWVSITRRTSRGKVVHPQERVSREEALKTYTIYAAWRLFAEDRLGSIEPGKLADMVVLDRDYLTCPEDAIPAIEPVMVIQEGKIVLEK
ncbi:MAG: amidohydrolase [Bryobacterales bacterium]|nr:amidohydrolase [Bryobacteraceae bacterium]MDW8130852.1 amidohydrolase [Bryobacterales bacterium]